MTSDARPGYLLGAHVRLTARVMFHLQRNGLLLSEIGDIFGVGRQYVHWLITLVRDRARR